MELTYHQEVDYLIPNLTTGDEKQYSIGKYGSLRRAFLKEHRPILYNSLCLSGKLLSHLADIDNEAREHVELLIKQLAKAEGVTENLKSRDQMAWVGAMNNIKARAKKSFIKKFCTHNSSVIAGETTTFLRLLLSQLEVFFNTVKVIKLIKSSMGRRCQF